MPKDYHKYHDVYDGCDGGDLCIVRVLRRPRDHRWWSDGVARCDICGWRIRDLSRPNRDLCIHLHEHHADQIADLRILAAMAQLAD